MDQLLTPKQVAEQLNVDRQTLYNWRKRGMGPSFVKIGYKMIRYDPVALEEWITGQGDKKDETIKNQS